MFHGQQKNTYSMKNATTASALPFIHTLTDTNMCSGFELSVDTK